MYSFVMCHVWVVSYVMCGLCRVSCATAKAKATAIYLLPANCPTMCTVGWITKTKNTPKNIQNTKIVKIS